jgi:AbrB family looped-hinge helix DNA binding protein
MTKEVIVTGKGQITIPLEIRSKLGICEGSRFRVDIEGKKIIFTKIPSIFELAGTSKMSMKQAFRRLDSMREKEY